jgi:hypothetical protein
MSWRVASSRFGALRHRELLFLECPASREVALDVRRPRVDREGKHCLDESPVLGGPLVWHVSPPSRRSARPASNLSTGQRESADCRQQPGRTTAGGDATAAPSSDACSGSIFELNEVVLMSFGATDPHSLQMLGMGVAAVAMIILAQAKGMLEERAQERCAACRRLIPTGRRCPQCG